MNSGHFARAFARQRRRVRVVTVVRERTGGLGQTWIELSGNSAMWSLAMGCRRVSSKYSKSHGRVAHDVPNLLSEASGHGKRLITQIDLIHKELDHDHSEHASREVGGRPQP